jgi:hypothetical protein
VLANCSAQQSSTPQQGINVPAEVIRSNMKMSHFFTDAKVRLGLSDYFWHQKITSKNKVP